MKYTFDTHNRKYKSCPKIWLYEATYLILGADIFQAADLLLAHCRHHRHHEVLPFIEPTFNLHVMAGKEKETNK